MVHPIWELDLFTRVGKEEAKCKLCNDKPIKLSNQSIKGLKTHLGRHPDMKKRYEELEKAAEASSSNASGSMDDHVIVSTGSLTATDKKVLHFIACANVPFSVINEHSFRMLFASAKGGIELKDESHYRQRVLPRVYELVSRRVRDDIHRCSSLAFTLDIWTGPCANFISLTVTGVTEQWRRVKFLLACREFPGEHRGVHIKSMLEEILKEWKIPQNKCQAFVHDQASNMRTAFNESALEDADCAAHMINLVVKNGCIPNLDDPRKPATTYSVLEQLISHCRKIVSHFRHSNQAYEKLAVYQEREGLKEQRLVQDVVTRWNSTYFMVRRLLKHKRAIDAYLLDNKRDLLLNDANWALLEELCDLLKPAAEFSANVCLDKQPISMQVSVRRALLDVYTGRYDRTLSVERSRMVDIIRNKFGELETYRTVGLAHALDPRFKDTVVDDPPTFRQQVLQWLSAEAPSVDENDVQLLRGPSPKKSKSFMSTIGAKYARLCGTTSSSSQPSTRTDNIEHEFMKYLREPVEDWESDPLDFWKLHATHYPLLAAIARRYLSVPATSVASEQTFSVANNVYDNKRSCLTPLRAEMLIFLNKNLPLIGFRY